jgi:hypothetical protein
MTASPESANRELNQVERLVEEQRLDDVGYRAARVEAMLKELSESDRAPLASRLAELLQRAEAMQQAENRRRLVDAANRNLRNARSTLDEGRLDHMESMFVRVESSISELVIDDRTSLLAQLEELKQRVETERSAVERKRLLESIEGNFAGCEPGAEHNETLLRRIIEVVESDHGRKHLDATVTASIRERVAQLRGQSAAGKRRELAERIQSLLNRVRDELSEYSSRPESDFPHAFSTTNTHVTAAKSLLGSFPVDDAAASALAERVAVVEAQLVAAADEWHRIEAVRHLRETWEHLKGTLNGWQHEDAGPDWSAYVNNQHLPGMPDLLMPMAVAASHAVGQWLGASSIETRERYRDDEGVAAIIADATSWHTVTSERLHRAFGRIMEGAELAQAPTSEHDVTNFDAIVVHRIEWWLRGTGHLETAMARAVALRDGWATAVEAYKQEGLDLYNRLSAEADAAWPAIERSVTVEDGFDPMDPEQWRGRAIKLERVYNRIGWDYNSPFDFATAVHGVAIAGNYDVHVRDAVRESEQRTRNSLDAWARWDVIGVVEGRGFVDRRNNREMQVNGVSTKLESWDSTPCVVVRIVALHAGPVAVGPSGVT